jgi:uncharacterized protein YukE
MKISGWSFLLLGLLLVPLIACSSESAKEKYCDDLDDLRSDIQNAANEARNLNVQKTQEAVDQVKSDVNDVKKSAKDVNPDGANQLSAKYDAVATSIQNLGQGGGGSLAANFSQLQTSVADFSNQLNTLIQEYNCK